jgi:DNA adenine methylase
MIKTKTERKHSYTPLRYPGGKTSLFAYFASLIEAHGWKGLTYIEPFAGGAGAALSLLFLEKVNAVVINDYDPAIYAFWKSATESTEEFVRLIEEIPVTVSEWELQKEIYKAADLSDPLKLGFATFYLNRTNRSGILNAGPIGGKQQLGIWKIDARYNKSSMIDKIRLIGLYRKRITVLNQDGNEVIEKYAKNKDSFFYVDPPYFVKGADLYLNAFKLADHQKLATTLSKYPDAMWLLSYDNEEEIVDLYENFNYEVFSLKYSAHHDSKSGSELMVFSDAIDQGVLRTLD